MERTKRDWRFNLVDWLFAMAVVVCLATSLNAKYSGGSGEPANPYQIATADDLNDIGNHAEDFNKCFIMTADINLSQYNGTQFKIIGKDVNSAFSGVFRGNGHLIINLTYQTSAYNESNIGLFGYVVAPAKIVSVYLENILVDAKWCDNVGSLAGYTSGQTYDCRIIDGNIIGNNNVGGLVGVDDHGYLRECRSHCYVYGKNYIGGLVGYAHNAQIENCEAMGEISGYYEVGGLVGYSWEGSMIRRCRSIASVKSSNVGGICYGGFVGYNSACSTIEDCYSAGRVTGAGAGGFAGGNMDKINRCYTVALISTGSTNGGFVSDNTFGTLTHCFWNTDTAGISKGVGQGNTSGVIGKNTQEMQNADTFMTSGWDLLGESQNGINEVWAIDGVCDYPRLSSQRKAGDISGGYVVNWQDFALLANLWGTDYNCCSEKCVIADIDYSGTVDLKDLKILTKNWCAGASCYTGGKGSNDDPFLIANEEDMNKIDRHPEHYGASFKLSNDINLAGYTETQFNKIGIANSYHFVGLFNGNGFSVNNFNYTDPCNNYGGLFECIGITGEVSNLNMESPNVTLNNKMYIGSLAAILFEGRITRCHVYDFHVSGGNSVGGLVGLNLGGIITDCTSSGELFCGSYGGGGLSGINEYGIIDKCLSSGHVNGIRMVGGLVGTNYLGANMGSKLGPALINKSGSTAHVIGAEMSCGGLVGQNTQAYINESFSSGIVDGNSAVGGLSGSNLFGCILDSWSTGTVTAVKSAGGLIGTSRGGNISHSYAAGPVICDNNVGALVGRQSADNPITLYESCFWDIDVNPSLNGIGNVIDQNVRGDNTAMMQTKDTFSNIGWDFVWETINGTNDIWAICEGVSYPRLAWEFTVGDSDNNKSIDFVDFAAFGNKWLTDDSNLYCGGSDLTGNEWVDLEDLAAFAENWLQ